ncbi:MAG TPA: hypothetical protein PLY21_17780, partial [Spirochaetota bacterium]|nr:hypothetical protein [Spirochaetota bacterium]
FRDSERYCEIITDPVATRTIWYYHDENLFIASTSQRAIILYLGRFEFDDRVIPWMLSTGSLGPTLSWDKRIRRVPPDTSVILDKKNWLLRVNQKPIEFVESKTSDADHEKHMREVLETTFRSLKFDFNDWILPLSGGYDSRGILCLLKSKNDAKEIRTITWGLKTSLENKTNDAYVATQLAKKLNVPHRYFCNDIAKEPAELIINRFLINGEGRVDHVGGYMDGFQIWKHLFESNIQGIIRGDEGFGWTEVLSPLDVRKCVGFTICTDYSNLKDFLSQGSHSQDIPPLLERKDGETFSAWRDRLYHTDRISTILAALSDLKLSYVEIVNPLLTRKIVYEVRRLPDHLRTLKALYKKIVKSISPDMPYATVGANADNSEVMRLRQVVDLLRSEISSDAALNLFSAEFIKDTLKNLKVVDEGNLKNESSTSLKSFVKQLLPSRFKNIIKTRVFSTPELDYNIVAFRMYIIMRMRKLLADGQF